MDGKLFVANFVAIQGKFYYTGELLLNWGKPINLI